MSKIIVTYRDTLGYCEIVTSCNEIVFLNGEIYFDSNGEECRIKFEHVVSIRTEPTTM